MDLLALINLVDPLNLLDFMYLAEYSEIINIMDSSTLWTSWTLIDCIYNFHNTAIGCQQCSSLSVAVVKLKGKYCWKPHCHNGVVDTNISSVVEFQRWWVLKSKIFSKCWPGFKNFIWAHGLRSSQKWVSKLWSFENLESK